MSKHGRFEQQKPKKQKKSAGKIALIAIAVILGIVIAAVIAGVIFYNSMLNRIPRAEHTPNSVSQEEIDAIMNYNPDAPVQETEAEAVEETIVETTEPPRVASPEDVINVLVVGQAARAGEEHRMADTMILVSVNTFTKEITLTSFLRDTYVKLPDYKDLSGRQHTCGKQKLTLCYHLGYTFGGTADAMLMTNQCLLENFGVEVDYNIEVDFEGVISMVDYMGGLELDLTQAEADYLNDDKNYPFPIEIPAGPFTLDGTGVLAYARMRKASGDNDSDINRTSRQRIVLQKMVEKLRNSDLEGLMRVVNDFMPLVTTNMTNAEITKVAAEVLPLIYDLEFKTGTCPVETTYWGEIIELGGYPASILQFDMGQNKKIMKAITEGTPLE